MKMGIETRAIELLTNVYGGEWKHLVSRKVKNTMDTIVSCETETHFVVLVHCGVLDKFEDLELHTKGEQ